MTERELDQFLFEDYQNTHGRYIDEAPDNPYYESQMDKLTDEEVFKLMYGNLQGTIKKVDRKMDKITNKLDKLDLNDDPMDTSNLADGSIVLQDADGNEFTAYLTRGKGSKKN